MGKDLKGKELGKGICQHKSGRYMARYTDRFGKRKCLYDKNLHELRKKLKKAKAENELSLNIATNHTTLDEWFLQWMKLYKSNLRQTTLNNYTDIYNNHISPFIGSYPVSNIKSMHIHKLLIDLEKEQHLKTQLNIVIVILKDLFRTAQINNLTNSNPTLDCKAPSYVKKEKHIPTMQELTIFFKWSKGELLHNAFVVHISTGIRPGELYGLKVQDIDFEKKIIHIRRTLHYGRTSDNNRVHHFFGETKTASSNRTVPISSICEDALKSQLEIRKVILQSTEVSSEFQDLLFYCKSGSPLAPQVYKSAIYRTIDKINQFNNTGEHFSYFTPHAFRHIFGTQCYQAKVDLKVIQNILGHSSLSTTSDIYVHSTNEATNEAMKTINSIQNELLNKMV